MASLRFVRSDLPSATMVFNIEGPATSSQLVDVKKFLMSHLPAWAPTRIDFTTNESRINDDIVAQRLSMVPFGLAREDVEGERRFHLASVPGRSVVLSSDIVGTSVPNVIITYIDPGKSLDLDIICDKGTGLENYRYSTVSAITFPASTTGGRGMIVEMISPFFLSDEQFGIFRDVFGKFITEKMGWVMMW